MTSNSFMTYETFFYFKNHHKLPTIKWHKLPLLHSAKCNSRAYVLIGYFLIPTWRCETKTAAIFIANPWQKLWFGKQLFDNKSYEYMLDALTEIKCVAALKCFTTH